MSGLGSVGGSSGRVVIYDRGVGLGVSEICLKSTQKMIKDLVDERMIRVDLLSEISSLTSDPSSIGTFVIPGGNYLKMAGYVAPSPFSSSGCEEKRAAYEKVEMALKEEERQFEKIAKEVELLILNYDTSYLGICAGAMAPCASYSMALGRLKRDFSENHPSIILHEEVQKRLLLNLYPGGSVGFAIDHKEWDEQGDTLQVVKESGSIKGSLFFKEGCFFPNVTETVGGVSPLLKFAEYGIKGSAMQIVKSAYERLNSISYTEPSLAAAISYQTKGGMLVLSGVHPEITASDVEAMDIPSNITYPEARRREIERKAKTVEILKASEVKGEEVMSLYLKTLGMPLKTA